MARTWRLFYTPHAIFCGQGKGSLVYGMAEGLGMAGGFYGVQSQVNRPLFSLCTLSLVFLLLQFIVLFHRCVQ